MASVLEQNKQWIVLIKMPGRQGLILCRVFCIILLIDHIYILTCLSRKKVVR